MRIGRNGQSGFWCGFCQKIVKLEKKSLEAWDERFNHIDNMHFKKGQRIESWYPLDKDVPKGQLKNENVLGGGSRSTNIDAESDDEDSDVGSACKKTRDLPRRNPPTISPPTSHVSGFVQPELMNEVQSARSIENPRSRFSKKQRTDAPRRSHWAWRCVSFFRSFLLPFARSRNSRFFRCIWFRGGLSTTSQCQCKMFHNNLDITPSCWGESCNEHRICTHCYRERVLETPAE